ncbi:MAG: hypothetical protein ABIL39_11375 [candidate division WOR-3 bacterium]
MTYLMQPMEIGLLLEPRDIPIRAPGNKVCYQNCDVNCGCGT